MLRQEEKAGIVNLPVHAHVTAGHIGYPVNAPFLNARGLTRETRRAHLCLATPREKKRCRRKEQNREGMLFK